MLTTQSNEQAILKSPHAQVVSTKLMHAKQEVSNWSCRMIRYNWALFWQLRRCTAQAVAKSIAEVETKLDTATICEGLDNYSPAPNMAAEKELVGCASNRRHVSV